MGATAGVTDAEVEVGVRAMMGMGNRRVPSCRVYKTDKGKEKIDIALVFGILCGHSNVDGGSSGSKLRLDEELGFIPLLLQVQGKAKPFGDDASIHSSTDEKFHVNRLRYDRFSFHLYVCMVNVIEESQPICFRMQLGNKIGMQPWMKGWQPWMKKTFGIWCLCLRIRWQLVASGCIR